MKTENVQIWGIGLSFWGLLLKKPWSIYGNYPHKIYKTIQAWTLLLPRFSLFDQ